MEQEFALHKKSTPFRPIPGSGSAIRYGMIILIELLDAYYRRGCSLTYISVKNGFSLTELEPIAHQLEEMGLIAKKTDNHDWFYLKEEPESLWILKVMPLLKSSFLSKS